MLALAAAAFASLTGHLPPSQWHGVPEVQARATVRILSAVRLRVGKDYSEEGQQVRDRMIGTDSGFAPARLIEFE